MTSPGTTPPGGGKRGPWWLATMDERSFFYAGVSAMFNVLFAAAKLVLFVFEPLVRSVRVVNVGSAMVLLVLAQAAILSFASTAESAWGVGVSALIFGGATVLGGGSLTIYSAWRARTLHSGGN